MVCYQNDKNMLRFESEKGVVSSCLHKFALKYFGRVFKIKNIQKELTVEEKNP